MNSAKLSDKNRHTAISSKLSKEKSRNPIYAPENNKNLEINVTKELTDLYNRKTLVKEIVECAKKCKDTLCSWTERISIIKMSILPKVIYRLSTIRVKILMLFFTELGETILKFVCNHNKTSTAKVVLTKKNKARG
jgi:hypothetical protein